MSQYGTSTRFTTKARASSARRSFTALVYRDNGRLWHRSLDRLRATQREGTQRAFSPFFSPDGQTLGFWAFGELKRVPLSGGTPRTVAAIDEGDWGWIEGATWGADDTILFAAGGDIRRVSASGGTPALIIPFEEPEAAYGPQLLPDGDSVLYTLRSGGVNSWDASQVEVQSISSGDRTVLVSGRDGRYLSTGHLLYAVDDVLFAVAFDARSQTLTGPAVPLVRGVANAGTQGATSHFAVSEVGTLAYVPADDVAEETAVLEWVTPDGERSPTGVPPRSYGDMRVSPDGTRVAVSVVTDGNADVWVWRLEEGPLTRLTFDEAADDFPLWTQDGSRIVFWSGRDGGGLFWKLADGTGEVERLLQSGAEPQPWGWSPDGQLVFSQSPGDIGLVTVTGDGTVEKILDLDFSASSAALSPDGRWLAYTSNELGEAEVLIRPFPNVADGHWQVSENGGLDPVWSPDGRRLYFYSGGAPVTGAHVMAAGVETEPGLVVQAPVELPIRSPTMWQGARRYDIAPDGARFIVRRPMADATPGAEMPPGGVVVENWMQELIERVPVN